MLPLCLLRCRSRLRFGVATLELQMANARTIRKRNPPGGDCSKPASPAMLLALLLGSLSTLRLAAETNPAAPAALNKSQYHLFNPTPTEAMRELTTDRPDKTESPFTVDAGHFQIESDLATHTRDRDTSAGGDTHVRAWSFGTLNLKAGLWNDADLQLVLEPWSEVRTKDRATGTLLTQRGFGDIVTRFKLNFWGNDGGRTAFGIMPFVKAPTSQHGLGNNAVEGGVIFPLALGLPAGWELGAMTEFDFNRNAADSGRHAEFINSVTVGHDLFGHLGAYAEFFSQASIDRGTDWIGTVDFGLTYGLTENIQLDGGINIGVTPTADDLNFFAGISARF